MARIFTTTEARSTWDYTLDNDLISEHALPSDCYNVTFYRSLGGDILKFDRIKFVHDDIIDLPSPEYKAITDQIKLFLNPETKEKYKKFGFVYKRGIMLHGAPGTGKTILVNRLAREALDIGSLVFYMQRLTDLPPLLTCLNQVKEERLCVIILEEFDEMCDGIGDGKLLPLFDGQVQKNNVIYLATTNHLNKISKRFLRPGRFASICEVKYPNSESRYEFLLNKLGKCSELNELIKKTEGLTIDQIKEVIQGIYLLDIPKETVFSKLKGKKLTDLNTNLTKVQ